jgi:hypothetical protein
VLDVGCGQLIVEGKVKARGASLLFEGLADAFDGMAQVKQGQGISHFDREGIVFKDGSKLSADVIVLAYDLICDSVILHTYHVAVQETNLS